MQLHTIEWQKNASKADQSAEKAAVSKGLRRDSESATLMKSTLVFLDTLPASQNLTQSSLVIPICRRCIRLRCVSHFFHRRPQVEINRIIIWRWQPSGWDSGFREWDQILAAGSDYNLHVHEKTFAFVNKFSTLTKERWPMSQIFLLVHRKHFESTSARAQKRINHIR